MENSEKNLNTDVRAYTGFKNSKWIFLARSRETAFNTKENSALQIFYPILFVG